MAWPKGVSPTNAKVSDDEFITAWRDADGHTPTVERLTGLSHAKVFERRRAVERKLNIELRARATAQNMVIRANRTIVDLAVDDGYVIVFGDAHFWPGDRPTVFRAMLELIRELKPVAIINNGDSFDGASVSRHADIGHEKKPTVEQEIEANRDRLFEIREVAKACRLLWNLGNHCMRYETYLANKVPQYAGVHGMALKDHFPEWTPAWRVDINAGDRAGHTVVRHRENGGMNAGKANAQRMGVHSVTGHDHVAEVVYWANYAGTFYSLRHGMTADAAGDPQFVNYLEAKQPSWLSSFGVLRYKDGALLRPQICEKVADGVVQWGLETFRV